MSSHICTQIAAKGNNHFAVYKDSSGKETETHIRLLPTDERIREIASMLSGKSITEATLMNARELLRIESSPTINCLLL